SVLALTAVVLLPPPRVRVQAAPEAVPLRVGEGVGEAVVPDGAPAAELPGEGLAEIAGVAGFAFVVEKQVEVVTVAGGVVVPGEVGSRLPSGRAGLGRRLLRGGLGGGGRVRGVAVR